MSNASGIGILPAIRGSGATSGMAVHAVGILPAIVGSGNALAGQTAHGEGKLPGLVSSGKGYAGYLAHGTGTLPGIGGHGSISRIFHARGSGRLPTLTGEGRGVWSGDVFGTGVLPAIQGSGFARTLIVSRRAIVMNLATGAVTHYENFSFDSLASFNGVLVGGREDGLFICGGDSDLGTKIQAEIQSGRYDLSYKIPREAWMAYRTDGDVALTVKTDKQQDPYEYIFQRQGITDEGRAKVGKGIKGRFFAFGLKNISGTRFDLNLLRIFGEIIRKRSR